MKLEDSIKKVLEIKCGIKPQDIQFDKTDPDSDCPDTLILKGVDKLDLVALYEVLPTCIVMIY